MSLPALITRRLRLEPAGVAHLDLLAELNADPEVMRFILGRGATREETEAEWVERLGPRTDAVRGLGYWVGFVGPDLAGWWCISADARDPAVASLGYRLRRDHWGLGLATEGALALVEHAFTIPEIERVEASTMAVNASSRRVLEKVGLAHVTTWHEEFDDPIPGTEQGEVGYLLAKPPLRPPLRAPVS